MSPLQHAAVTSILLGSKHAREEAKYALNVASVAIMRHARGEIDREQREVAIVAYVTAEAAAQEAKRLESVPIESVLGSTPLAAPLAESASVPPGSTPLALLSTAPAYTIARPSKDPQGSLILTAPDGHHLKTGYCATDHAIARAILREHHAGQAPTDSAITALAAAIAPDLRAVRLGGKPACISHERVNAAWRSNRKP